MNPNQTVSIETYADLNAWLERHQLPIDQWGQGEAKTVEALWHEIEAGETQLQDDPPLRVIRVVKMLVRPSRQSHQCLIEVEQELRDGRRRSRNQAPGEKIIGEETIQSTALRGLQEEVGIKPDLVSFLHVPEEPVIEEKASPSFPGLKTQYRFYTVEMVAEGLPEEAFWTEDRDNRVVRRHQWDWVA